MMMKLAEAQKLALALMKTHGLADWHFSFDRAKRRFGSCQYQRKLITLSRYLTLLNPEAQVRETILHEIAHALVPKAGHGKKWQEKCLELGIRPERCYSSSEVNQPDAPYQLVCPYCQMRIPRYRKPRRIFACKRCCERYNAGRFDARYQLKLLRHP